MRRVSSARSCWKRLYPPRIALYLELDHSRAIIPIDKIYGVHVAVLLVETAKSVDDKVLHSCINKFEPFFLPAVRKPFVYHSLKRADIPERLHRNNFDIRAPSERIP